MPMCDAYIPHGALTSKAEGRLAERLTDLLLRYDGLDPADQKARSMAWVLVHRYEIYVGGSGSSMPHYRFVCCLPEGQLDEERRAGLTKEVTEAVVEAEGGTWPDAESRVWVLTCEVPDGTWGMAGRIRHLPDLAALTSPDLRKPAERHLARRRAERARAIVEAAGQDATASA